jgi:hypothetical protein
MLPMMVMRRMRCRGSVALKSNRGPEAPEPVCEADEEREVVVTTGLGGCFGVGVVEWVLVGLTSLTVVSLALCQSRRSASPDTYMPCMNVPS